MSKEERNYEIYDREMLGLIHALEDWRHFLEYQDAEESPMAGGDDQMEEGAAGTSSATDQVPVRIPSTSDIAEVHCNPDDHLSPNLPVAV